MLVLPVAAANADEAYLRLDDPSVFLASALGKQVDVRFSDGFASTHLQTADVNAVTVSDLPDGEVCFFGPDQGLDPADPRLKDVAREDAGDICVPRGDASVKVQAGEVSGGPPMPFYSTDKAACAWSWQEGKGIGVWTEVCQFDNGRWKVDYDAANDWYALSVDGGEPYPVLRQFHVTPGTGPESLLPELKRAGLVLDDAECVFAAYTNYPAPAGWSLWEVVPTGARKEAYDSQPGDEVPEPPCGELGMAVDITGFFAMEQSHPDRVLYMNLGQDGTMFDPFSLTFE